MSMDARKPRGRAAAALIIGALHILISDSWSARICSAATFQTRNFSVSADSPEFAEEVGHKAEQLRKQLAVYWLGQPLPNWSRPCKLRVREGSLGAGGQTTFQFSGGEVLNWDMFVQGSRERILDSVLPHEINHTIFACHFRRPLPRWADEGAATLFEHRSEQLKQIALLDDVINNSRERISLRTLMSMKEYPKGMRPMLILYAQGYALADFLVQQKGRRAYLQLISDGERLGWEEAIRKNFDHEGIESLEKNWHGWVLAGMPKLTLPRDQMMAAVPESREEEVTDRLVVTGRQRKSSGATVMRSQSPDQSQRSVRDRDSEVRPKAVAAVDSAADPSFVTDQDQPEFALAAEQRNSGFAEQSSKASGSDAEPQPETRKRSARIRAPGPVTTRSSDSPAESEAVPESSIQDSRTRLQVRESGPENARQLRDQFEPTGLIGEPSSTQESADRRMGSKSDSDPRLPGERSVESGGIPGWAGFPGQEKLF